MFYSTDLLRKKTPLGAIWIAAHGKKLPRGRIMQLNISDTCEQIMDPAVPHALRLQAILCSGVTVVFERKSYYLLEDCKDALKRVVAVSEVVPEELGGIDLVQARPADINMADVDIDPANIFAPFPNTVTPHRHRRGLMLQDADDLILMPSIPESQEMRVRGAKSPAAPDEQEFFVMGMDEVMEVPELPEGAFDFPQIYDDFAFPPPPEDVMMMMMMQPDGDGMVVQEDAVVPAAEGGARRRATVGHRKKKKKALVDRPDALTISAEYHIGDSYHDLLVHRPRATSEHKQQTKHLFSLGPATGHWPSELQSLWKRCNEAASKPRHVDTPPGGDGGGGEMQEKRGAKRGRLILEEEEVLGADGNRALMQDGYYYHHAHAEDGMPLQDDMQQQQQPFMDDFPVQEDYYYNAEAELGVEYDAFGRPHRPGSLSHSGGGDDGLDFEAERLRAALNGTPGAAGDYKDAMFQLGLTPASDDNAVTGGSRPTTRRFSAASHRSGRLSEKSSDPGSRRLSDMLAELAAPGDLAAALPAVGEEEHDEEAQRAVSGGGGGDVSQFTLLEESGPTLEPVYSAVHNDGNGNGGGGSKEHLQTIHVLRSLRDRSTTAEVSLAQATKGLRRLEAAKVFAHVLVGRSQNYVQCTQERPYGDIILTFNR